MFFNNYGYIRLNYTSVLQHLGLLHHLLRYYLFRVSSIINNLLSFIQEVYLYFYVFLLILLLFGNYSEVNFCNFVVKFITKKVISCFCCFLNCFFEVALMASFAYCLAGSRSFRLYLPLKFLLIFSSKFWQIFSAKDINQEPFENIESLG